MRELMEKLPLSTGDMVIPQGKKAGEQLEGLRQEFSRARKESSCYERQRRTWDGSIDEHLLRFLLEVERTSLQPSTEITKRNRSATFIRARDPAGEPMPSDIEKARVERWMAFDSFFTRVAHHGGSTVEEFEQRLVECIIFLVEVLGTSTAKNLDALDQLIREAECDA
jgi:hypothetical protein